MSAAYAGHSPFLVLGRPADWPDGRAVIQTTPMASATNGSVSESFRLIVLLPSRSVSENRNTLLVGRLRRLNANNSDDRCARSALTRSPFSVTRLLVRGRPRPDDTLILLAHRPEAL